MRTAVRQRSAGLVVALLALVVLGASPAFAQGIGGAQGGADERHEGIGIGVKGGWLFPTFSEAGIDFDNRTGQQIGVFFGGNRPGLIGVMAEVNYGQKGFSFGGSDFDVNFVSVPVVIRVNGGSKSLSGVSFYGIAGPQLDWLINGSLTDLENTQGFEISLVIGGGIEITRFIVELRYIKGLRSISREFDVAGSTGLDSKAFAILFGFRFN